jgi:hypothetical protein
MSFTLHVDAQKWRHHLADVIADCSAAGATLLPVIKGNGYGFGREVLARETQRLNLPAIAVGTVFELDQALAQFPGTCVVLEPYLPDDGAATAEWQRLLAHHADRIVATVAGTHLQQVHAAGAQRVRLEGVTSMQRFGMSAADIDRLLRSTRLARLIEALTLHLPTTKPDVERTAILESSVRSQSKSEWGTEVAAWVSSWRALATDHELPLKVSVSHLPDEDLHSGFGDIAVEVRVGTSFWLGAPESLRVTGTVLSVTPAVTGRVGYTQVAAGHGSQVVVVSGGTSHGVAMAAPSAPKSVRRKAISIAEGLGEALGRVASPFRHRGRQLRFVEPPHMQVSMLWTTSQDIAVGDELECRVRHTTAQFDRVTGLD